LLETARKLVNVDTVRGEHESDDFRNRGCRQHTTLEKSRGRIEER
jgi:hypothetical protein